MVLKPTDYNTDNAIESIPIRSIPIEITAGKAIVLTKAVNGTADPHNGQIVGGLTNPPIEVGKGVILTTRGSTSEITSITQEGLVYRITTETGSEYLFDPSRSIDLAPSHSEQVRITSIPAELTANKVLVLTQEVAGTARSKEKAGQGVFGVLMNPPIEIGKIIRLARGHTSEVTGIVQEEKTIFRITTQNESIYVLDLDKAIG